MDINQYSNNQESLNTNDAKQVSRTGLSGLGKLTWSALGLSAMLALSACSGDKAADEPVVDTETPAVEVIEEPVVEAPVVEEPVEVVEPVEETAPPAETDSAAEPEVLAADAGAKLYEAQCKMCHEGGLLEAPKFGNKEDWAPHLVKDIDTLHMHSAKGFNKMPAQASDTVSEAQVHAAVDYMVAAVS